MSSYRPQVLTNQFFVLASGSPRRREFMELLGLTFVVITPASPQVTKINGNAINETPLPGEAPPDLVQRLSRIKAEAVAKALPSLDLSSFGALVTPTQAVVIGADTIVVLEDKILGKPNGPAGAVQMLKNLREQPHFVYSGLSVATASWQPSQSPAHILQMVTQLHQSKVWMRPYTDAEINAYVASGDPLDKAGAYGIQNKTFAPVAHLEGCFASVMGFPLGELAAALNEVNILLSAIAPLCAQHTGHSCCQK